MEPLGRDISVVHVIGKSVDIEQEIAIRDSLERRSDPDYQEHVQTVPLVYKGCYKVIIKHVLRHPRSLGNLSRKSLEPFDVSKGGRVQMPKPQCNDDHVNGKIRSVLERQPLIGRVTYLSQ